MIHVVLCDDHAMIRRGIKDTLSDSGQIIVTGEAGSQEELKNVLRSVRCEILVLDLNLPGRGAGNYSYPERISTAHQDTSRFDVPRGSIRAPVPQSRRFRVL